MRVIALASFTLKSYLQEKVLLVVMFFAALLMISSYVMSPLAVGAQQKIVVDIGLAAISIFAVALIILLGASSFHIEKEQGILRALLAKPVSRVEFVLGKYVGTVVMVSTVVLMMACVHMLVIALSGAKVTSNMVTSVYLTLLEGAVVTALLSFFASFTSPVLGSLFTISSVVAGHFSSDLLVFAERMGKTFPKLVATGAYFALPNLELLNIRSEAVHGIALPEGFVLSVSLYAVFYAAVVLYLATLVFRAKEVS